MIVLLQSHKKSELFLYEFNVYISNQLDILSLSFCLSVLCIVLLCEQMFLFSKKSIVWLLFANKVWNWFLFVLDG